MSDQISNSTPGTDEILLDEIFEYILEAIENGERPDVSAMLRGYEHLNDEVEAFHHLAEQVAQCNPRGRPTISGYIIIGELGHGGMGSVYLARRESLGGRPVALKVIPPSMNASPRGSARFLAEARALAKVRHTNIVTVLDVIEDGSTIAYAMEWVDGSSLDKVIQEQATRGPDPAASRISGLTGSGSRRSSSETYATRVCKIGASIAWALEEMHLAGLLHRDVKPSNILIRNDGTPLLADFGLVRDDEVSMHTQAGQFIGTPAYAAPEQLRGENDSIDARTDVYGLGATLYHALALQRPFDGRSTVQILSRIESGAAISLRRLHSRISRDLETIVAKAMDSNPAHRYESARELAEDLERLLGLQTIRARPAGLVRRAVKYGHRNRRSLIGALIGSVIAVALGVLPVIYIFLVPGWVEADMRDARTRYLNTSITTGLFNRIYGGRTEFNDLRSLDLEMLSDSQTHYVSALRFKPWLTQARLELGVIEALMAQAKSSPTIVGEQLRGMCPITAQYLMLDLSEEGFWEVTDDGLNEASDEDMRLLGLAAWLRSDPQTVIRAWSLLDAHADPLIESGLGYIYLIAGRPELAYPRLSRAADAYPDVSHLQVFLADAAVQCGDYRRAESLLDALEDQSIDRATRTFSRIRSDLYTLTGRFDEARAFYESPEHNMLGNPLGWTRYTQLVEQTDGIDAAVLLAASRVRGLDRMRSYQIFYIEFAERWWDSLSVELRIQRLDLINEPENATQMVLEAYAHSHLLLSDWPEPIRLVLPGMVTNSAQEPPLVAPDPDSPIESLDLRDVCVRLGLMPDH